MDKLDVQVLRALFTDVRLNPAQSQIRASIAGLARELHVSEPTLRSRVRNYERSGFLNGWGLFVNPNLIGLGVAQVRLDVRPPATTEDAIEKIGLMNGVWYIASYHGNALGVGFYFEDDLDLKRQVQLMARIANSERTDSGRVTFPSCSFRLTSADLAIIASIQEEPGRAYASVARDTGLSSRTVRRHLNRMVLEGAVFAAPRLDPRKVRGAVFADVFVFYASGKVDQDLRKEVLTLLDPSLIAVIPGGPDHTYAGVILDNVAGASELVSRLRSIEGVKAAFVELVEGHRQQYEVFALQVRKLSEARRAKVAVRAEEEGVRAEVVRS